MINVVVHDLCATLMDYTLKSTSESHPMFYGSMCSPILENTILHLLSFMPHVEKTLVLTSDKWHMTAKTA